MGNDLCNRTVTPGDDRASCGVAPLEPASMTLYTRLPPPRHSDTGGACATIGGGRPPDSRLRTEHGAASVWARNSGSGPPATLHSSSHS
jgi:hypothetical protein